MAEEALPATRSTGMNVMYDFIAQIFQQEAGRVIAALYASLRDLELVEDALQDALVLALEHWPVDGVPPNPGAWITTAAHRKAIDRLRREQSLNRKKASLRLLMELEQEGSNVEANEIPDERLKLIFTCCHPARSNSARTTPSDHSFAATWPRSIAIYTDER